MKAIIIDDEPRAIELLKGYLSHFKTIELVKTFRNGLKAFEFLNKENIDLVFLDINMPHITGISLSKMIDKETKIIFTTAYSEYAVESYDVNAIDYLLKPINLERFTKAISKVLTENNGTTAQNESNFVYVKSGLKTFRLNPNEIIYVEKDGNYSTYYVNEEKIIARESVLMCLEKLPMNFLQVHKSYIVNIEKIISIEKDTIQMKGSVDIPIGFSFKVKIKEKLNY